MNDNKLSPEEKAFLSLIVLSVILMIFALKFLTGAARPPKQMETTHISKDLPNYVQEEYCYMLLLSPDKNIYISDEDKELIARCVMSEAGGESEDCQEAVATVILNRYMSPR